MNESSWENEVMGEVRGEGRGLDLIKTQYAYMKLCLKIVSVDGTQGCPSAFVLHARDPAYTL